MHKRITPLLLGLVSLALVAQTSAPTITPAEREANLKGCADLGIATSAYSDPSGWIYDIPSPDGTYVVEGHHLGSHGCHDITIYQCVKQQSSGTIGCEGIFPPESNDLVFAQKWVSNDELRITRNAEAQIINVPETFKALSERPIVTDKPLGFSPDGAWQIFSTYRDGMPELYRMRLDGSDVQRLTRSLGEEHFYGWSPDGTWMIFDYGYMGQYGLLTRYGFQPMRMLIDGSGLQPLMTNRELNYSQNQMWVTLVLSPDRKWLLMEGASSAPQRLNKVIYRLGVPKGVLLRLTNPAFTYDFQEWAPDGRALIRGYMGQEYSFELIDVVSRQSITLIRGDFAEFQRWTDDHQAALFQMYDDEGYKHWYRAELDGSGVRQSNELGN